MITTARRLSAYMSSRALLLVSILLQKPPSDYNYKESYSLSLPLECSAFQTGPGQKTVTKVTNATIHSWLLPGQGNTYCN